MKLKNFKPQVLHNTAFPTHGKLGVRLSTKHKKQQNSTRAKLVEVSTKGADNRMRRRMISGGAELVEEFEEITQEMTEDQRAALYATFFDEEVDSACEESVQQKT